MQPSSENDLLSLQEAAQVLDVPPSTVREWIGKGLLKVTRRGGDLFFEPSHLQAFFEKQQAESLPRIKRVLVIDDDPLVGDSLKNLLEKLGLEASVVTLGLAALDLAARDFFDLIIADIRMPGMDGIETLKAIREIRRRFGKPPLQEMIITAYADPKVKEEAEQMEIREYFLKPFELDHFTGGVWRLLKRAKEIRAAETRKESVSTGK